MNVGNRKIKKWSLITSIIWNFYKNPKWGTLLLIVYFLILKDFNDLEDSRWTFMVNTLIINYSKATRIYTDQNQKWKKIQI